MSARDDLAGHPDAELLELGRRRAQLIKDSEAAEAELDRRCELARESMDAFPDVLITRPREFGQPIGHPGGEPFTAADVFQFRSKRLLYLTDPDFNGRAQMAYIARAEEVIAAWEALEAHREAMHVAAGVPEQSAITIDLDNAIEAIERRMIAIRATTLPGLRLKAQIAKRYHFGGDHISIGALIDDLTQDAGS
jgi:hypothetical protein